MSSRHVVEVEEVAAGVERDRASEMEQLVRLLGQVRDVERVHAVAADDNFVVALTRDVDDADADVDVVTVSAVDQLVVDVVLHMRRSLELVCQHRVYEISYLWFTHYLAFICLLVCQQAGAREPFFWLGAGGVKIMRATFREVNKSVINDNKKRNIFWYTPTRNLHLNYIIL